MRHKLTISCLAILAAVTFSLRSFGVWSEADRARPASHGSAAAPSGTDPGYVMHEWGTFTTYSGSDGIHLDFRPLDVDHRDLPDFVFDRGMNAGLTVLLKSRTYARVRMETPVIYFYTDRPRKVRVSVDFPEGLITEFYPPVKSMAPAFDRNAAYGQGEAIGDSNIDWGEVDLIPLSAFRPDMGEAIGDSNIDWGEVDLIPLSAFRPDMKDAKLAEWLQNLAVERILPRDETYTHYRHARDTDAALVHVNLPEKEGLGPRGRFIEKFLFYRGVGNFNLPIQVAFDERQSPMLINDSSHTLKSAVVVKIDQGQTSMAVLDRVGAQTTRPLPEPKPASPEQIAEQVQRILVDEGLYEKEAGAMVRTWQDSWFSEDGYRVLYAVPAPITDRLLPLHLDPKPVQSVRVLVGRIEVMSPELERRITQLVSDNQSARVRHGEEAAKRREAEGASYQPTPFPVPEALVKMDRFAEPALARVAALSRDAAIRKEAQILIRELRNR